MLWLGLLLFGTAIGVVSGLLGIGGGVLLIPGLMLLFGYTQVEAQGTSLAVMIPPIGIFAALVYYQHGYVRLPVVGVIALGFMLGAFGGAHLVPRVDPKYLRLAFGALLLYLGFTFVLNPTGRRSGAALPAGVSALLALLLAHWLRRPQRDAAAPTPPPDEQDYHI